MRTIKIYLILVLCLLISTPAYAVVEDPNSRNLIWPDAFYDYRDYGAFTQGYPDDLEGKSGGYFQISVGVVLRGGLSDYDDIREVAVEHVGTKRTLALTRDEKCNNWLGEKLEFWSLFVKPEGWMFDGTWRFYLHYNNSRDGKHHRQTIVKHMGPVSFPIKPSGVVKRNDAEQIYTVSWIGIGNPQSSPANYRVRVFDVCVLKEYRGVWNPCASPAKYCEVTGTYDPVLNLVTFQIPLDYEGYTIRLENRVNRRGQKSRASQCITLY